MFLHEKSVFNYKFFSVGCIGIKHLYDADKRRKGWQKDKW